LTDNFLSHPIGTYIH